MRRDTAARGRNRQGAPARAVLRPGLFAALLAGLLAPASTAGAALCGDVGGDGFLTASDALAALRLAVASGDDRRADVAPAGGNGKVSASDALEVLRASVEGRVPACRGAVGNRAFVSTAPYDFAGAGGFAVVDVATRAVRYRAGAAHGDAVIRTPDALPVLVNRFGANSLKLVDPGDPKLATVKECSVSDGFNSNPQDVVFATPTKGYVTLYEGGDLLVIDPSVLLDPGVDPACDTLVTGRVDLSSFDGDGVPEMDQMALVGDELFVALQLLDTERQPKEDGKLAVVDTASGKVQATIPLSFRNPFAETKGLARDEFTGTLYVGGPGVTGAVLTDGGIEAIDPATHQSKGMLLTGGDIQADLFDFVIVGTKRAFAIVADRKTNSVVDIDLATRSVRKVLLSSTALITDIEMTDQGELWVAYRGETAQDPPSIRIFRALDGVEVAADRIAMAQAPFTLAFPD